MEKYLKNKVFLKQMSTVKNLSLSIIDGNNKNFHRVSIFLGFFYLFWQQKQPPQVFF